MPRLRSKGFEETINVNNLLVISFIIAIMKIEKLIQASFFLGFFLCPILGELIFNPSNHFGLFDIAFSIVRIDFLNRLRRLIN